MKILLLSLQRCVTETRYNNALQRTRPRKWHFAPLKSQVEVTSPEQFFLRPTLARDKFPEHRTIELPPAIEDRITAQEAAGHLVFDEEEIK